MTTRIAKERTPADIHNLIAHTDMCRWKIINPDVNLNKGMKYIPRHLLR